MSETDRERDSQEIGERRAGRIEAETNICERLGGRPREAGRSQEERSQGEGSFKGPQAHLTSGSPEDAQPVPVCPRSWAYPMVPSASSKQAGLGNSRQAPKKSL